jgi:hypothetical protein
MQARTVALRDARGQGASLRVTRHPEQGKVVLSHWRDGVCVASTPVEIGELPELIALLADALGDAVRLGESSPVQPRAHARLLAKLRSWMQPRLAQIVELRAVARDNANTEDTDK